jgi:hypothetical protein
LRSKAARGTGGPAGDECQNLVVQEPTAFNWQSGGSKDFLGAKEGRTDALHAGQTPAVVLPVTFDWQAGGTHPTRPPTMNTVEDGAGSLSATRTPAVAFAVNAAESCAKKDHARESETARALDTTGGFAASQGGTVVGQQAYNVIGLAQQGKNHAYPTEVSGCLQHKGLSASGNEAGTLVACDTPLLDGYNTPKGGINHGPEGKADPREVLRVLRGKAGEEAFQKWCLGVIELLREAQVLRPGVHGSGVRSEAHGDELDGGAQGSSPTGGAGALRTLWAGECAGRASSQWGLARQQEGELGAYLSQLSQPGPRQSRALHDLWQASEGLGLLRQALLPFQEVRRSLDVQAQPTYTPDPTLRMIVRRLTPLEAGRLMSVPDDYLDLDPPLSDSAKYRLLGNGVVVNVAEWIGRRIVEVLA